MYACVGSEFTAWPTGTVYADLGGFDMIVEVVTESLDVRDYLRHALRGQVSRKQDLAQSVESSQGKAGELGLPKVT
jgi:hypothetical protein